jgi:hypothetical protein
MTVSRLVLSVFIALSFNSISWAHHTPEHKENAGEEHGATNLFPKPVANKSKTGRMPKVTLLEPKALSSVQGTQVTLKWQTVSEADSYRVQVATDPNFKWLVANEDFYKGTSYEVKNLESGKHYYWRVYAWKSDNDPSYLSSFADFSSFETK